MAPTFTISPEKRASLLQFFCRQLFVEAPPLTRRDVDLSGQTAIITGSNSGLGLETARQLLDLGCNVILAVRNTKKGEAAQQELAALAKGTIEVWELDLSSYDSITSFAERTKTLERLDIAVLCAGVYNMIETFCTTGYEESIQVNYLSNMLLATLLLPSLQGKTKTSNNPPARIVVVSSDNAAWAKLPERSSDPLLPAFKKPMRKWDFVERYSTSKLLGQMYLSELSKQVSSSAVTISFANCGLCHGSKLARQATGVQLFAFRVLSRVFGRECAVGARTFVHAASGILGEDAHGQYIEDAKIQPMAPICYKPDGLRLAKKLYEETLDEFSFAKVRDIISEL